MAIEPICWRLLSELRPKRLLSLGYGDLLLPHGESLPVANDAAAIATWHNWNGTVYDTTVAFASIGVEPTYIDIHPSRNCERVVDLNYPLDIDLIGQFDAVLDPGTLEHCFNIGQAFENCTLALNDTGVAVHTNPLQQINHGFWNISPTAYADFYENAGFSVELSVLYGPLSDRRRVASNPHGRFGVHGEAVNLCIAKRQPREKNRLSPQFPTQWKYRQNPNLKAASAH